MKADSEEDKVVNEEFVLIFVTFGTFGSVALFIWMVGDIIRKSKMAKAQSDMQTKLIEKFGSSPELLDYMKTDAGQRFIQTAPVEAPPQRNPYARILRSITAGTILTFLGIGLLSISSFAGGHGFTVFGTIGLAIGLGFLVSAGISYFLSKSWGLFDRESAES
jgi:hypothetical protein